MLLGMSFFFVYGCKVLNSSSWDKLHLPYFISAILSSIVTLYYARCYLNIRIGESMEKLRFFFFFI